MQKEYKRNPLNSIFWILIGLLLALSSLRDGQFQSVYDGFRVLVGLVAIYFGVWGFMNPIVIISEQEIIVKLSIDKKRKFKISEVKVEVGEEKTFINFSEGDKFITLKLKELTKSEKARLLEDIKNLSI
jgi:hypothetical protein